LPCGPTLPRRWALLACQLTVSRAREAYDVRARGPIWKFRLELGLFPLQGDATMPASGIAIVSTELRSHFLDGLAPSARKRILGAATQRRFRANSVVTNHGHPADHLFLLTKGLVRYFFITEEGRKFLFHWLGPRELFGGLTVLSAHSSYLFSTETVTDTSVLVWDRPTIRGLIAHYPRLLENALLTASDYLACIWHPI